MTLFNWTSPWKGGKRAFRLCNGEEGLVEDTKAGHIVSVDGNTVGTWKKDESHKIRRFLADYIMGVNPSESSMPSEEEEPKSEAPRNKKSKRKTKKKGTPKAKPADVDVPKDPADLGAQMDAALGESEDD